LDILGKRAKDSVGWWNLANPALDTAIKQRSAEPIVFRIVNPDNIKAGIN
jgi:hypothetical protein